MQVKYKETFRVFSKDEDGCITADKMKFVLSQVGSMEEAEQMMNVVDRNRDGAISSVQVYDGGKPCHVVTSFTSTNVKLRLRLDVHLTFH